MGRACEASLGSGVSQSLLGSSQNEQLLLYCSAGFPNGLSDPCPGVPSTPGRPLAFFSTDPLGEVIVR